MYGFRALSLQDSANPRAFVFDLLEAAGDELLHRPYRERRAALESLIGRSILNAPFELCPATSDRSAAAQWIDAAWGASGIEGVVCKGLDQPYRPGARGWIKVRTRLTYEGIVGGVTGPPGAPHTLLLGRYTPGGRLRLIAQSTPLPQRVRADLGDLLIPDGPGHPWHGRTFSAGWGRRGALSFTPVRGDLVAEFEGDTSVDAGVHRHAVRVLRIRAEMHPMQVPKFGDLQDLPGQDDAPEEE